MEMVRMLIDLGANVRNCYGGRSQFTTVLVAVENNSPDILEFLIHHGADVNNEECCNENPLNVAAEENNKKCMELLLDAGIDTNQDSAPLYSFQHIYSFAISMLAHNVYPTLQQAFRHSVDSICVGESQRFFCIHVNLC